MVRRRIGHGSLAEALLLAYAGYYRRLEPIAGLDQLGAVGAPTCPAARAGEAA